MIRNIDHANVIHYGADSLIISSKENAQQTCTKIINDEFPSPELISQLDKEFEICSKTHSKSIRKALRKERHDDHSALVLEYVEGKNLTDFFGEGAIEFSYAVKTCHVDSRSVV